MQSGTSDPGEAPHSAHEASAAVRIEALYLDHLLTEGRPPVSVYALARQAGLTEQIFYTHYPSLAAIEEGIWRGLLTKTLSRLEGDPGYTTQYGAREKLLAFYYTWLEELTSRRSYVQYAFGQVGRLRTPHALAALQGPFRVFAEGIVAEGFDRGELVNRPVIGSRYADGVYRQLILLTRFWAEDNSPNHERTDAAVEKYVRLSFELMGENVFDAALDAARFFLGSLSRR